LTKSYGSPSSILLPAANDELIFLFQNTTLEDGQGALLSRTSFENGKVWDKFYIVDEKPLPRSSLSGLWNPVNNQLWAYFFYFTPQHRVGYITRPSGSVAFSAERPALDPSYGHFMEGIQAALTYNKTIPTLHLTAVSEKGLLYSYSLDGGVTYNFGGSVAPLPDAYELLTNPEYSNETVFLAVENNLFRSSNLGQKWDKFTITNENIRHVSISMCRIKTEWCVYYLGMTEEDKLIFGYFDVEKQQFINEKLPIEQAASQVDPTVICYNDKKSGKTRIGIILADQNDGAKAYFATVN